MFCFQVLDKRTWQKGDFFLLYLDFHFRVKEIILQFCGFSVDFQLKKEYRWMKI